MGIDDNSSFPFTTHSFTSLQSTVIYTVASCLKQYA